MEAVVFDTTAKENELCLVLRNYHMVLGGRLMERNLGVGVAERTWHGSTANA